MHGDEAGAERIREELHKQTESVVHHGGFIPQYEGLVHPSISASYTPV